jgi:hypothetical protein
MDGLDVTRENARNTEHAWRDRAQEAAAHQEAAAGMGPPPGLGGPRGTGGGRGTPVYVTGASGEFLNQVSQSWGTPGGAVEERRSAFDPVLNDQRAVAELSRQMVEDLRTTSNMVLTEQANAARAMVSLAQDMRVIRQEERDHMQGLLDTMTTHSTQQLQMAQAIQTAYVSGGGAPYAAIMPPVTSGSPHPGRRGGGGGGAGAYPASHGFGGHPGMFHHGHLPPHSTLGGMRRTFFRGVTQRFGIPAAQAAGTAPTAVQSLVSNVAGPMSGAGMRAIPIVGSAIAVANGVVDAMDWLSQQRKANAQYQQIYSGDNFGLSDTIQGLFGGDVNTGSGQRAAGLAFRMSQTFSPGGLAGEDADKLFQGVSSLGFNNDARRKQMGFATDMYRREGMSVDDSLQLINVSARYANQSLAGVADGLKAVSKAAKETGQSAKMLRDTFTSYYGSALAGGAGASASSIAQSMTLSTAGVSRDLAGANMSPMLSNPMYLQQVATAGGMTSGQLQSQMAQGNFRAFTGPAQKVLDQRMLGTMDPSVRKRFTDLVKEYGGNDVVAKGPGAISRIATDLMGDKGWNVYAARSALQSIGVDTSAMNDQQVAEFFVGQMTSGGMDAQAKDQQEKNRPKDIRGQIKDHGATDFYFESKNKMGFTTSKPVMTYLEQQKKTGKSDPAMEAAIRQFGGKDQKVQVQTKQGVRVVSLSEAMRDYPDQVSTGSAIVAEGDNKGKKLSEVTGVVATGVVPGKNGVPDTAKQNAKSGDKVEDFENKQGAQDILTGKSTGEGGGGGVVRVEPSPELARLFNFSTTGNVTVDQSAAQGVPPTVQGPVR